VSWPLVKLHEVSRPKQWKTISARDLFDNGYPVYGANGKIGFYSEYTHEQPTLMITCRGATCGNVHISEPKSYINGNAMALDGIDQDMIDIKFLFYFFLQRGFNDVISGSAQPQITGQGLTKVEIPLPPLTEQKRIAAILDKADAIRRKRQQAIQLADDFLRAVFLDMFGDLETSGWGFTTVERMAAPEKGSMRTGPFGSDLKHSEFIDEGVSVLGIDNAVQNKFSWGKERFISTEKYKQLKRYTVKPGDVLITIMGTCGRCAVVPDDIPVAINTKHLCCITLDKKICLPSFLHAYFLMHPHAKRYLGQRAKGAIMDGLNMGMIKEMPFPKVPIEFQIEYETISNKVSHMVKNQGIGSEAVSENFSSLSQKAFNGKL